MYDRLTRKYVCAAFLIAVGVGSSSPAMAGFQWVAPSDSVSSPPMGVQTTNPVQVSPTLAPAASSPEIISPVVITGAPMMAAPAPVPVAPVPVAVAPQVAAAPVMVAQVDNTVVMGFARSVPLAVALRQILPVGFTFSVDQDVDMGTLVSFQGGRPWRETLRDSLEPVGLIARERGQMVEVSAGAHAMVAPAPVAVAPAYQAGMEPRPLVTAAPAPVAMAAAPAPMMMAPAPAPAVVAAAPAMVAQSPAVSILPQSAVAAPLMPMGSAPAPTPMAATAPAITGVTDSWTAERGETLRKVLENWSRRANVEFDWLSEYDYPLQASVAFSGGFEGAVRSLLAGFEAAHPQPVAELHSNPNLGQMVLVVQARGNTNSD